MSRAGSPRRWTLPSSTDIGEENFHSRAYFRKIYAQEFSERIANCPAARGIVSHLGLSLVMAEAYFSRARTCRVMKTQDLLGLS